jgi:hypothetical protein
VSLLHFLAHLLSIAVEAAAAVLEILLAVEPMVAPAEMVVAALVVALVQ